MSRPLCGLDPLELLASDPPPQTGQTLLSFCLKEEIEGSKYDDMNVSPCTLTSRELKLSLINVILVDVRNVSV